MQASHIFDYGDALQVGHAVRVLCVTAADSRMATRFAALGGLVETEAELYTAIAAVIEDPAGYDLLVVDCDSLGGRSAAMIAERSLRAVDSQVPVLTICGEYESHDFPESRDAPICLRAPVSDLSLRIGFEHALRDFRRWLAA